MFEFRKTDPGSNTMYKPIDIVDHPIDVKTKTSSDVQQRTLFALFCITSILLTGLILLLLFMNGTLWQSASITNYQYNATGIALFIVLGIIGIFFIIIIDIWYLVATSKRTFTLEELQSIVHSAVKDFNKLILLDKPNDILMRAKERFDVLILEHRTTTDMDLIEGNIMEELLEFIHGRFKESYPHLIIPNSRWAFNNVGGVYARQKLLLANFKEYLCSWGTVLEQGGFSGRFINLNEGDVMICGTILSYDPESKLCLVRKYEFGDTSFLKNGYRRHCLYSKKCYMISFALHKKSNILKTLFPGVIIPYLFQNNDAKSFWIQIGDAWKGIKLWIWYRLSGGE